MILSITGCTVKTDGDAVYDEAMRKIAAEQEIVAAYFDGLNETPIETASADTVADDVESKQTLTVLVCEENMQLFRKLATRFMAEHKNVDIKLTKYSYVNDSAKHNALITRLLSDPPDVFDTTYLSTEKLAEDKLFIDLNELLDGADGINRDDYFDNVIRGCESGGKLFYFPLMFSYDSILVNKQYLEEIGTDISETKALNYDQRIELYQRTAALHPDEVIYVEQRYSMSEIFEREVIYDIDSKTVFVNTPLVKSRLEAARLIPTRTTFTPDYRGISLTIATFDYPLFTPTEKFVFAYNFSMQYIYFVTDHPQMKFSEPLHYLRDDGSVYYKLDVGLSITQKCRDKNLAWEFVKFCMESTESMFEFNNLGETLNGSLPVNRERFMNYKRDQLHENYENLVILNVIVPNENAEQAAADKEAAIAYSLVKFEEMISMLSKNIKDRDGSLFYTLIYPDLYQYYADKQDADKTLINIQNKLELYVNE